MSKGTLKTTGTKIHLAKYFNEDTETSGFFRPMLKVVLGSGLHTRKEWKRLIEKELSRKY